MIREFIIVVILFFACQSSAQTFKIYKGDTINVRDSDNKKQGVWIFFYDNGNIKEKGIYLNNKKDGVWEGFYESGQKKHEITYVKNRPDGYAKFYYEDGVVSEEGVWKINKWVGDYKYFHENGNLAYDWHYNESGRRTGEQKYYYDDGSLMIKGDWTDGKKAGVLKEFYPDGSIKSEINFIDGKIQVESVKEYKIAEKPAKHILAPDLQNVRNQQTPTKVTQSQDNNNGKQLDYFTQTGYYKTYNEFKKLDREGDFVNGKLINGKRYIYDDNGNLITTLVYKDGKVVESIDE